MNKQNIALTSALLSGLVTFSTSLYSATTEIVTVDNTGAVGDFGSTYFARDPAISSNGRYALFLSEGDLWWPEGVDNNELDDIYLRHLKKGTNELISIAHDGSLSDGHSEEASMCKRAKKVVFASRATNLTADEIPVSTWGSARSHIYLRDRKSGTTSVISPVGVDYESDTGAYMAYISKDCKHVAYHAYDSQGASNIKIYNTVTGNTVTLPRPAIDFEITGYTSSYDDAYDAAISGDGRFVTFLGSVRIRVNLSPTSWTSYYRSDVFLHDRDVDGNGIYDEEGGIATTLITNTPYDTQSVPEDWNETWNRYINISGNGRYVIFCSGMSGLVADDTNQAVDTFIYDVAKGTNTLISRNWKGEIGNDDSEAWWQVYLSHDGRYAVFSGWASNLVPEDTLITFPPDVRNNGNHDSFLLDRDTDKDGIYDEPGATGLEMITLDSDGQQHGGGWDPMVTDNAKKVIFGTFMSYEAIDTNGTNDGYVRDRSIPVLAITKAVYSERKKRIKVLAESDLGAGDLELDGYGPMVRVRQTKKKVFWESKVENVDVPPESITVTAAKAWSSVPLKTRP